MNSQMRVATPPPKPLMIWDGECHFCRRWIERWREITAGEVEYASYQEIAERFPEIPREQFQLSVVYIDKTGQVFIAAEAVYRSLCCRPSKRWLWWSYEHIPGFAAISEFGYRLIARHRGFASAITRLLWGKDVRPPTYFWAHRWFLRALGLVYLIAFVSLWLQIDGLVGANGILPISDYLSLARGDIGYKAVWILPTLCWFNSSNAFLHFLCGGGVLFSILLICRIAPAISSGFLFISYLSLSIAGQAFLSFQWDILLLESGFLAIFFAPWQLWPPSATADTRSVSPVAMFLLKFLLFKLMFMSGVVKLTSGDNCWGWINHSFHWSALTALDYHYWTQPLPTVFAWFADKHPEWFKKFSVTFCLVVEIIVPFFIWAPRRPRIIAAGLIIFLQLAIAITGNYCFFNLLTIALCLLLIDDAVAASLCRGAAHRPSTATERRGYNSDRICSYAATAVIIVTVPINGWLIFSAFKPHARPPNALASAYEQLEAFRIVNGYGLFRVMTKDRGEIVLEGSVDGMDWLPYEFKWKPGDVKRVPGWCAPHQPRLDWQMWFAALETPQQNSWLLGLVFKLLQGSHDTSRLLAHNPFPDKAPRYIRATFYRYRFTTGSELRQTGAWWKRQELREYLPGVSLNQLRSY